MFVNFVITVCQETFRVSIDSFCSPWSFLCLSVMDGLIWVAKHFVPGVLYQKQFQGNFYFIFFQELKLASLRRLKGIVLSAFWYSVKRRMHSIPKINIAIVWIRRFLFVQARAFSLSQKLQPWAWRPLPFVTIREDCSPNVLTWNKLTWLKPAVELLETWANYHFECRSPRINSAECLRCGILDWCQGRTHRSAGSLSRRCHLYRVEGSQHRLWKVVTLQIQGLYLSG